MSRWRRLARMFAGACALVGTLEVAMAQVSQGGLRIHSPPDPKPTESGTVLRRAVTVVNRTSETAELLEEVQMPDGWRLLPLEEPAFQLPSMRTATRFVAVAVPKSASGAHRLIYRLRSVADGVEAVPAIPMEVEVRGRSELRMELPESPEFLVAGVWSTNRIRLVNSGGTDLQVQIRVHSTPVADLRFPEGQFQIAAGRSMEVDVASKARPQGGSQFQQSFRFQVVASGLDGVPVAVSPMGNSIEVILGDSHAEDPWVRIPSYLRFGVAGEANGNLAQTAEISGIGSTTRNREEWVSYRIRPTLSGETPLIFDPDEYTISYSGPEMDWTVGDGIRPLTPLMQAYGRDRGMRLETKGNPTRAGALWATSVFSPHEQQRSGGFLEQDLAPWWSVRSAFLQQRLADPGAVDRGAARPLGDLFSLQSRMVWTNRFRLEVESARSLTDFRQPGSPEALRIEAGGRLPGRVEFQAQSRKVGSGFLGPGRDNDALSASVARPIGERSRLELVANQNVVGLHGRRAERLGEERTGEFQSESVAGQVQRNSNVGHRMTAGLRDRSRELRRNVGGQSVAEDGLFVSIGRSGRPWTWGLDGEIALAASSGQNERKPVGRVGGRLEYHPTVRHSVGIQTRYGDPVLAMDLAPVISTGFNSDWQISDRDRLNLGGGLEQVPSTGEGRWFGTVHARRVRANGHEISARGQTVLTDLGDSETGVFLQYSIPFGLPVGHRKGLARIHGRIVDLDDGLKVGVSKALVTLNREWKTLTAANGSFEFPNLRPGKYVLELEARSIGFGRVVAATSPIVIQARADGISRVEVGVTAAAAIEATITIFEDSTSVTGSPAKGFGERYRPASPHVGEVVEIRMEKAVRRTLTDAKGVARFTGLVPGTWSIQLGLGRLPANHQIEKFEPTFPIRPGETHRLQIRVLPRIRVLRFIDSDT